MVTTRRTGSGSASGQGNDQADHQANPILQPPPPPAEGPDWRQMMANQTHLIDLLAQSLNNVQNIQATAAAAPQAPPPHNQATSPSKAPEPTVLAEPTAGTPLRTAHHAE